MIALLAALAVARTAGAVVSVTAERVYLDAGARDGLAPGQVLELRRGARVAGRCKVELVSASKASCAGQGAPGDTFALSPPPRPAPPPPSRAQPPLAPRALAERRSALEAAQFPLVQSRGGGEPGVVASAGRVRAAITHVSYAASGVGPWHEEAARVQLAGVPLGAGFAAVADLSARHWTLRDGPQSFQPGEKSQLWVREAALVRRPATGFELAAGRVRAAYAPGAVLFDGAQAGVRSAGGAEAGLFGGAVPDADTLAPSTQRGTVGAYWTARSESRDGALRLLRHEARVAFSSSPELGRRMEAEALVQASLGRALDVSAEARGGYGLDDKRGALDAVRVDASARPLRSLSLSGGFRYEGLAVPELDGGLLRTGGGTRHADLSLSWDASSALRVRAVSGLATDLALGATRRFGGPELAVPFGAHEVSAGWLEETRGRSAFVQLLARPRALQLMGRLSWFHEPGLSLAQSDDLGASLSAQAPLGEWCVLRLTALGRAALDPQSRSLAGVTAGLLRAELGGRF